MSSLYLDKCYLMDGQIFSNDLFDSFQKELKTAGQIPFPNGDPFYHRVYINIFKEAQKGLVYRDVEFSKGELVNWSHIEDNLIENDTVRKAIETVLRRFGRERGLDGKESFALNVIKHTFETPMTVARGPWHSDYQAKWSMITMLSDPGDWEGGRLQYIPNINPARNSVADDRIQKTNYIKNRAIMFDNFDSEAFKDNYHSFEAMKITKPVERIILTLFQYDQTA